MAVGDRDSQLGHTLSQNTCFYCHGRKGVKVSFHVGNSRCKSKRIPVVGQPITAESGEFCDLEDFKDLLEDDERWEACLAELGIVTADAAAAVAGVERVGSLEETDDAQRRLRAGVAALVLDRR